MAKLYPEEEKNIVNLDPGQEAAEGMKDYRAAKEAEMRTEEVRARIRDAGKPASPEDILLEVAASTDTTVQLHYLVEPYLPMNQVVGFFGRGGTAKSSFVASLAACIGAWSAHATLWISTEEDPSWIKVRHVKAGGGDGTLFVYKAVVTKKDLTGRAVASTFNVYEHLDAAIQRAKSEAAAMAPRFTDQNERPVRLVVLDTAVALTTWGRSESPNDDSSVKRLIAFLYSLCNKHEVSIAVIGHNNKGKHDFLGDTVAGSGSWTSSVRQAFVHVNDKRQEFSYVLCTVKDTLTGPFAVEYQTYPVHTLHQRLDGSDSVLCAVRPGQLHWGHKNVKRLFDEATGRDREGEEDSPMPNRKQIQVDVIVTTLLSILDSGVPSVTRKEVQEVLGAAINARHWQEADAVLTLSHGVRSSHGAHGVLIYQRTVAH